MKIKVEKALKTLKGKEIKNGKEVLTLKVVCVNSLLADSEEKIDGNEKMKRFLLAQKIEKANELELKSEEITKLKNIIGVVYGPLVVGQAFQMLEGN